MKGKDTQNTNQKTLYRHQVILEIVQEGKLKTQIEIGEELNKRLSYRNMDIVSPATVNRDFKKLKLIKEDDDDYYSIPNHMMKKQEKETIKEILMRNSKSEIQDNLDFFVIKTEEGMSDYIGLKIASVYDEALVGYIPGRNFALLIAKDSSSAEVVKTELRSLIRGISPVAVPEP